MCIRDRIKADLTNSKDVKKALEGVDVIIQLAATTSGAKDIVSMPYIHVTDNAVMNSLILREAFEKQIEHFIFPSCTVMYQSSDIPVLETDFKETANNYKSCSEDECSLQLDQTDGDFTNSGNKEFCEYSQEYYDKDLWQNLKGFTDSFTYDAARVDTTPRYLDNDLNDGRFLGYRGSKHPFVNSELGEYMDHLKGDRKDAKNSKESLKVKWEHDHWK